MNLLFVFFHVLFAFDIMILILRLSFFYFFCLFMLSLKQTSNLVQIKLVIYRIEHFYVFSRQQCQWLWEIFINLTYLAINFINFIILFFSYLISHLYLFFFIKCFLQFFLKIKWPIFSVIFSSFESFCILCSNFALIFLHVNVSPHWI